MNQLLSLLSSTGLSSDVAMILTVVGLIWLLCAFVAVFLLPFVLFRAYRALGRFNAAQKKGGRSVAASSYGGRTPPRF